MEKFRFYSLWLCLLCVVVFLLQIWIPLFTQTFILSQDALIKPWQFLSAIFLHGSLMHLLYNIFALFIFGLILERTIGSKKFVLLFLVSGILANIFTFYFYPNSLGASGAIMALIGCLAVLRPMMAVFSFGIILPMFAVAIIWIIGSFLGIFGFGDQGIGYIAHLSGLFIGVLYGFFLRLKYKRENSSVYSSRRRIVIPEDTMRSWERVYMGK
jgi:membrane associated rhomboid family serine protease